jgi:adenylate cyclase
MRCPVCRTSSPSRAKFCDTCGAALHQLCPACATRNRPQARFCLECGTPFEPGTPAAATAPEERHAARAAQFSARLPGSEGTRTGTASSLPAHTPAIEEERRLVTVLFADVVGFTSFSEHRDPEEVRRVISVYFERLAREIRRFGGTIEKFIGDAIMALFGAPVAHEDDPQRAINAALEMQAAISEVNANLLATAGLTLQMRIGIMTGKVVGGIRSFEQSGEYTVTGDVVNTAARLQSAAGPGQILVGELTHQMSAAQFLFEPMPALTVKGKAAPVTAYLVKGRSTAALAALPTATPLIGRHAELRLLQEYLQRTVAGEGQIIALVGEAGIGKSRLVLELRRLLKDEPESPAWHGVTTMSFLATTQYATLTSLVRSLLEGEEGWDASTGAAHLQASLQRILGEQAAEQQLEATMLPLADLLGVNTRAAASEAFDAKVQRRMLLAALRTLVTAQARQRPLVLVLDDAQWIDQASLEVLEELVQILPERRILLLVTHRAHWQHAWSSKGYYRQINLGPLSAEECRALVLTVGADVRLSDEVIEHMVLKTGGNPFFLEEVVKAMRTGQATAGSAGENAPSESASALPATIEGILTARIDSLEPPLRRVLQVAAVIGQVFTEGMLRAVCGPGQNVRQLLERLIQFEFLAEQSSGGAEVEYRFRHGLIQEVAYQHLLIAQREALHLKIGECLEQMYAGQLNERSELLAYHFSRSPDKERAVHYLLLAGDHALRLYAHEAACKHYQQALTILAETPTLANDQRKADLHERQGDAYGLLGKGEQARAHYEQSLALAAAQESDPSILARLHCRIGDSWLKQGEFVAALASYARAEQALAGRAHDVHWARVRLATAQVAFRQGKFEQTRAACEETLPFFLAQSHYKEAGDVYNLLAGIELRQGHADTAIGHLFQSIVMRERSHDLSGKASCYSNLGVIYASKGEPARAIAYYRQGLELFEKTSDLYAASTIYCNLGMAYALTSDYRLACESLERGAALADDIGFRLILGEAYCQLARVCRITGQWQQTIGYLKRGLALAQQTQAKDTLIALQLEHGSFLLEQRQRAAAEEFFLEALSEAEQYSEPVQMCDSCIALALCRLDEGELAQAAAWLGRAAPILATLHHPRCQADFALARTRLHLEQGELDQAMEQIERARGLAQQLGNVLLLGQCAHLSGVAHAARQGWSAAQAAFEEAQLLLRRIGALPTLSRVMADYAALLSWPGKASASPGAALPSAEQVLEQAHAIVTQVGMEEKADALHSLLTRLVPAQVGQEKAASRLQERPGMREEL